MVNLHHCRKRKRSHREGIAGDTMPCFRDSECEAQMVIFRGAGGRIVGDECTIQQLECLRRIQIFDIPLRYPFRVRIASTRSTSSFVGWNDCLAIDSAFLLRQGTCRCSTSNWTCKASPLLSVLILFQSSEDSTWTSYSVHPQLHQPQFLLTSSMSISIPLRHPSGTIPYFNPAEGH
jgi:hypothetical protein